MRPNERDWQVIQTRTPAGWKNKIVRDGWHVRTIETATRRGGERAARRVIRLRLRQENLAFLRALRSEIHTLAYHKPSEERTHG